MHRNRGLTVWRRQPGQGTQPHVDVLNSLLVNARCRVLNTEVDHSSITLTNLERLQATDAVVLIGDFSEIGHANDRGLVAAYRGGR